MPLTMQQVFEVPIPRSSLFLPSAGTTGKDTPMAPTESKLNPSSNATRKSALT